MKKAVIVISGIVIFLGLVFFTPGIFTKSIVIEQELAIKRPVKNVYFSLINPLRMKLWVPGFMKIETMDGFIHGVGSRFLLTLDFHNKEYKVVEEIKVFEWKKELGICYKTDYFTVETNILLSRDGKLTVLKIKHVVQGENIFWRSVFFWFKPVLRNFYHDVFLDLQKMQEK